ncbi:MAG: hypothetical protein ACI965_002230, partial [Paraglaciecola sp.]
ATSPAPIRNKKTLQGKVYSYDCLCAARFYVSFNPFELQVFCAVVCRSGWLP